MTPVDKNFMYYDLPTYKYLPDQCFMRNITNCPQNAVYNADVYNGILNLTAVDGVPIFNTLPHFYNADESVANSVKIFKDSQKKNLMTSNEYDASYVLSEPYTGVNVAIVLNL